MDTSLSKALIIVAGVLLAMIVIAFMTFSLNRMSAWSTTSDQELLTKQKEEFNREYEVYGKDLMYGVDVISCLNKAKSNNDKIDNQFGEKIDSSYEVRVKVNLKDNKPLEESMTVYYMDGAKETRYVNTGPAGVKLSNTNFNFINTEYGSTISSFTSNSDLKTVEGQECKEIRNITEFNLTKDTSSDDPIRALLSVSNALSETVKNKDKTEAAKKNSWSMAEFKSALYDLKTRKFKCVKIDYSEAGRVNFIEFKEI